MQTCGYEKAELEFLMCLVTSGKTKLTAAVNGMENAIGRSRS